MLTKFSKIPAETPQIKWRQHPLHKNYYLSENGDIWSSRYGRLLKPMIYPDGYYIHIKTKRIKLSRLVAEAWLNLNQNQVVIHKNRNKFDNDLFNLIITDRSTLGKITGHLAKSKKSHMIAKYINDRPVKIWRSARSAAKDLGVSYQTVLDYANGKVKKTKFDLRKYQPAIKRNRK